MSQAGCSVLVGGSGGTRTDATARVALSLPANNGCRSPSMWNEKSSTTGSWCTPTSSSSRRCVAAACAVLLREPTSLGLCISFAAWPDWVKVALLG